MTLKWHKLDKFNVVVMFCVIFMI